VVQKIGWTHGFRPKPFRLHRRLPPIPPRHCLVPRAPRQTIPLTRKRSERRIIRPSILLLQPSHDPSLEKFTPVPLQHTGLPKATHRRTHSGSPVTCLLIWARLPEIGTSCRNPYEPESWRWCARIARRIRTSSAPRQRPSEARRLFPPSPRGGERPPEAPTMPEGPPSTAEAIHKLVGPNAVF
jgi:hypothetical protein